MWVCFCKSLCKMSYIYIRGTSVVKHTDISDRWYNQRLIVRVSCWYNNFSLFFFFNCRLLLLLSSTRTSLLLWWVVFCIRIIISNTRNLSNSFISGSQLISPLSRRSYHSLYLFCLLILIDLWHLDMACHYSVILFCFGVWYLHHCFDMFIF